MNEYLVGKVAVRIVIASGPGDAQMTPLDELQISFHVVEALALLGRHAKANAPSIPLQFGLWVQRVSISSPNALPALKRMSHKKGDHSAREKPWRDPVLAKLGHGPGVGGGLALATAGKGRADHSIVGWFTKYNLAWQGYARPAEAGFFIDWRWSKDIPRGGGGMPRATATIAHEIGHLFGAPDEYVVTDPPAGSTFTGCTLLDPNGQGYGKLQVANLNCARVNPNPFACLMASPDESDHICMWTKAHWGWFDVDSDGTLDIFQ